MFKQRVGEVAVSGGAGVRGSEVSTRARRGSVVESRRVIRALTPGLDLVALLLCVALLQWWSVFGAIWLALTFALLRGGASAEPHRRINVGVLSDLSALAARLAFALLALVFLGIVSRTYLPVAGLVALPVAVVAGRVLARAIVRRCRVALALQEPLVIVGTGRKALHLARELSEHPEYGCAPIGFVDSVEGPELPLPYLGPPESLASMVETLDVRYVIIADAQMPDTDLLDSVSASLPVPADMYIVPRFFGLSRAQALLAAEQVGGVPLVRLSRRVVRGAGCALKRGFDIGAAAALLIGFAPVMLAIALVVRLGSTGPALYKQRRLGMQGVPFELLKFRTMRLNDDGETTWSVLHDGRVTRIGHWLRRTGFDELPQLVNVLRGDMSLVGPRPERPYFVERFRETVPDYSGRLRVRPGITGWAQINGLRGDTSIDDRVRYDNAYVESWSIWRDIDILLRTVGIGVKSRHG